MCCSITDLPDFGEATSSAGGLERVGQDSDLGFTTIVRDAGLPRQPFGP